MTEFAPTLGPAAVVESAWRDQAIWSETASRLKAELSAWRYRAAGAGVLGAFLETLAGSLFSLGDAWWWPRSMLALAGAVILAVVPYVVKTKTSKEQVGAWVRARSASEALKETIYRYLVGAPPFAPAPVPAALVARCQALKEKVRDLGAVAAAIDPPKKERPLTLTLEGYVGTRVSGQIDGYYRPKARENAIAAKRLHDLEFILGLVAAALGAAGGLRWLSGLAPWVAVVTTAGGAVTAHLAASRYDHQAMTYFATAERLTALRDEWLASSDRLAPAHVAQFVDDCEHAISTENEAWLAEWTREKHEPAAGTAASA
jgi:SMODS and SLOG-associating 2TM effector domain 1/Protein of unknown function (DUF4231)